LPETLTGFINEAPPDGEALIGLSNEIQASSGDGWALIPFGDWPNERGVQRFGKPQAEEMVGYFKNAWARIKRAFVGMPILRGHPDFADTVRRERDQAKLPAERARLTTLANEIEARYPDRTVYGTIADMEVRADGLAIRPVLTEAGAALVNEGLKWFSPHWLAFELPPESASSIKAPVFLVSIGLTDRPNIPGTSLVNSAPAADQPKPQPNQESAMPKWLLDLLGLANEATEDQCKEKVTLLLARPEPTALVNEQTARTTLESQLTEVRGQLTGAETALANERTAHAATTTARNTALVSAAIAAGRIAEASRPVWLGRLGRDFAAEMVALANESGALKVTARTADLGSRKAPNTARDQFTAMVNERVTKGEPWDAAWQSVKATAEGKALFEQMQTAPAA